MRICAACRLRQEGTRCAACGDEPLRALDDPSLLVARKQLRLERFELDELSYPAKFFLGLMFVACLLIAPIAVGLSIDSLTGNEELAILGMCAMLATPWVLAIARPTLRWVDAGTRDQLSSVAPLALSSGEVRSGRVASCGKTITDPAGEPCLVSILSARERGRLLERESRSVELEVIEDSGAHLRVSGVLMADGGKVFPMPRALLRAWRLPANAEIALVRVCEGDRVEVRGNITRDQAASSYRDSAEIEVMRGPVEIRLL